MSPLKGRPAGVSRREFLHSTGPVSRLLIADAYQDIGPECTDVRQRAGGRSPRMSHSTRREFLRRAAHVGSALALPACRNSFAPGFAPGADSKDQTAFRHGVASGDPLPDRVILWTRVTPDLEGPALVRCRVAADPAMTDVRIDQQVIADAARDYTVKVDPAGLAPGTTYYYQFESGGAHSPVGRTRTAPAGSVDRLRVAVASCADYSGGFFNAYRAIAARSDLDLVLHLGDYIYENGNTDGVRPPRAATRVDHAG